MLSWMIVAMNGGVLSIQTLSHEVGIYIFEIYIQEQTVLELLASLSAR